MAHKLLLHAFLFAAIPAMLAGCLAPPPQDAICSELPSVNAEWHVVTTWIDANQNGVREETEAPLPGVSLDVTDVYMDPPKDCGAWFDPHTCSLQMDAALLASNTKYFWELWDNDNCTPKPAFEAASSESGILLIRIDHDFPVSYRFVIMPPSGYRLTTDKSFTEADQILSLGFVPVATTEPAEP